MERTLHWVRRTEELQQQVAAIGAGPLALDSEADSLHHYPEKVCLIQLSFDTSDLLVDPLTGLDLSPLDGPLRDRALRKLLHGADYDLRLLDRDCGLRVRGLFDTMIAARLTGETAFGLAALLSKHVGVKLDKRFQRADWSRRPLTAEMERYAVCDTRHLAELAQRLESRLRELGRWDWAREEFLVLEEVRWSAPADAERFRRIKGSGRLDRRTLAILRELHAAREELARRCDRPPFRILQDACLLEIARRAPSREGELLCVPGFPRRGPAREERRRWLEAVSRACALPEECWPAQHPRRPRREPRFERRLKALCRERDRVARELGLEPGVVGPRAALETALEGLDRGREARGAGELKTWQLDLLGPAIEALAR